MKSRVVHLFTGGAVSLALFLGVAAVSQWPRWQSVPDEAAVIRLSLRHGGARDCRPASAEELARLPPNMRLREICDRRRAPVHVRLELDGQTLIDRAVAPSGLWGTGPSRLYARFTVSPGSHRIALALDDTPAGSGAEWTLERAVTLTPGENLAIDFDAEAGGFVLHEGRVGDG